MRSRIQVVCFNAVQRHSLDSNNSIAKFTKVRPEDPGSRYAVGRLEMFGCMMQTWCKRGTCQSSSHRGAPKFLVPPSPRRRNIAKPRHSEITVGLPRRFALCVSSMRIFANLCDAHSALFGEAMPAVLSSGTRISESMRSYMISVNDLHACECPCTWFTTMVHLSLSLPNSILMVSHDSIVISCIYHVISQLQFYFYNLLHPS